MAPAGFPRRAPASCRSAFRLDPSQPSSGGSVFVIGVLLVVMMRFRPEGLMPDERRQLEFHADDEELAEEIGENIEAHIIPSLAGAPDPDLKGDDA